MKSAAIHDLPDWLVTSYGNGLAYEVVSKREGLALFFQGDDASDFHDELESLADKIDDYQVALSVIWGEHREAANEWKPEL